MEKCTPAPEVDWITSLTDSLILGLDTTDIDHDSVQPRKKLTRDQRRFGWTIRHGVRARRYACERALIPNERAPSDSSRHTIRGIRNRVTFKKRAKRRLMARGKNVRDALVDAGRQLDAAPDITAAVCLIPSVTQDYISASSKAHAPIQLGVEPPSVPQERGGIVFWDPTWPLDYYPCTACTKPIAVSSRHKVCVRCYATVYCNETCRKMDEARHRPEECNRISAACTTRQHQRLHKHFPPSTYGKVTFHHHVTPSPPPALPLFPIIEAEEEEEERAYSSSSM